MASEYSGAPPTTKDQHCIRDERRKHVQVYYDHLDLWADRANGLNPSALAVYICLVRHASWDDRHQCFPSLDTIAEQMRLSRPTIVNALKALKAAGLISIRKERVPGGYERSVYTLLDKPPVAPSGQERNFTESEKNFQAWAKDFQKPGKESLPELEPIELDATRATKNSAHDLPENGPAQQIVKAYCVAMNLPKPVNYGKTVGHAQKLADAGITPDEVPQIVAWLQNDDFWVRRGIDLSTVMNQAEKWRGSQNRPQKKRRYVV